MSIRKTKKAKPINNIEDIRKFLLSRFKSVRGETGEELRSVATSPIPNEDNFIEVFNTINTNTRDRLDSIFGAVGTMENFTNYKSRLFNIMTKIGVFNKECTDIIQQMKLCIHHPKKTENMDYFTTLYGSDYAKEKLGRKSSRVAGENNPGYNHGGKLSPFSKNYIKYEHLSQDDVQKNIQTVTEKVRTTVEDHPENQPTRIEYYLSRGMDGDAARKALAERQTTFSLEKCIERYGADEGRKVWQDRQDRWQETLSKLPESQKYEILRKKARGAWDAVLSAYDGEDACVYLMATEDKKTYKFGISTNVDERRLYISKEYGEQFKILETVPFHKSKVFDIETKLCEKFFDYSLFKKNIGTDLASGHIEYFCDIDESTAKSMWLDVVLSN